MCAGGASARRAEVIAVHALTTEEGFPSDAEFDEWCAPLREAGLSVRRVMEDEDPSRLLPRVAAAEQADLVVVGATQRGELAGFVLGGVVEELAYHGRRPVVIVPIPDPDQG